MNLLKLKSRVKDEGLADNTGPSIPDPVVPIPFTLRVELVNWQVQAPSQAVAEVAL